MFYVLFQDIYNNEYSITKMYLIYIYIYIKYIFVIEYSLLYIYLEIKRKTLLN